MIPASPTALNPDIPKVASLVQHSLPPNASKYYSLSPLVYLINISRLTLSIQETPDLSPRKSATVFPFLHKRWLHSVSAQTKNLRIHLPFPSSPHTPHPIHQHALFSLYFKYVLSPTILRLPSPLLITITSHLLLWSEGLCLPKIHMLKLNLQWMVLKDGALGKQLGCEAPPLQTGSVPFKKGLREPFCPFLCVKT